MTRSARWNRGKTFPMFTPPPAGADRTSRRPDRARGAAPHGGARGEKRHGFGLELFFRRWHLPSFHSQRGGRGHLSFRVFDLLHALSTGGEPGTIAGAGNE